MKDWKKIIERLIFKITSGRFVFTVVTAGVFSYMACKGILKEDRVMEVILIVLYAYFSRPRVNGKPEDPENNSLPE